MVVSGVTLAAAAKLAGAGGSGAAAWLVWRSMPEQVFRRKLMYLFRFGNLYYKIIGYKGRELRSYPIIKRVSSYLDRTEAAFVLPVGIDPARINENEWLFRQVFGAGAELSMSEDAKTFVLSVYSTSVAPFEYDAAEVDECIPGLNLPIYVGRSRSGDVVYDMVEHPHLLIAGETGSGKSVALRSVLTTLIRRVPELELYCADMKRSEFHLFRGIAQEVVMDAAGLQRIVLKLRRQMRERGDLLDRYEVAHVNDLPAWDRPPYIILAVDEVALLKKKADIMEGIEEIATIGRALGVFLILSMQRPDADVLDGKLKNNLTVRMAFRHADEINSRITIGTGEAAAIKQSEKGRLVLKLDGCRYVQGPHLELSAAREMLEPYKNLEPTASEAQAPRETAEEQDEYVEVGLL
ncbi:S-DNA-T family DNA segregation ATPase FtsK/SpoIIIE [Paenibacillus rhizosphaerae]|uniref:S-DNA-T family DNA segregation ATPase FtsK/SpoIIIE n=1 Tax=Paenibacillus rhizosphaerae TaxID=297318 RepID=A0A839U3X0_9BACL|nr:FtsK/SpoIIIE domain-containing protein [Paenibacillus rhizosphaerae]MBB3132149.1 S-DNA-T family DNA segregation ATPase FtsK/SpoIIIE [Paenibacillus rhizosphaerae]